MTKPAVVYHDPCDDGFGAAFVFWKHFGDEAEYIPASYGKPFEFARLADRVIYIVDFSFPLEDMLQIQACSTALIVLDHHKTARDALLAMKPRKQDSIVFDMTRSGTMLAWNYLNPEQADDKASILIQYIQDRDLYTKKLPGCDFVTRRIRSFPMSFESWNTNLWEAQMADTRKEGEAIDQFFQAQLSFLLRNKHRINLCGIDGMAVCATPVFSSEAGHELAVESGTFGCTYFVSNGKIGLSLRSNSDSCDVSAIAKQLGGGGHVRAAGCAISLDLLTNLVHGRVG